MLPTLDDCILDHVAIAVNDLEESVKTYQKIGLKFDEAREVVTTQKVQTAFASVDQNAHLELLCSTTDDGPIQKFIDKNGPGIHHLCFKVKDIKLKQEQLEEEGLRFIYKEPTVGAGGCMVNFIHPKSTGGVLIELSQKPE